MSPLEFAQNLAKSDRREDRELAIAMVARGLSDDDPGTFRQGWPLTSAIPAAARYLGLDPMDSVLMNGALALAPTVSDAMLNKGASARARK